VGNAPMLANWVQIEMDKTFENIKVDRNEKKNLNKILPFYMQLKHVQSLAFDFNYYIIQNSNILVKSIAC
jgi:hypothetical protein